MNRAFVAVSVVILGVIGGCSQGPNSRAALIERVKMLEEKIARVENDLRSAIDSRDHARQLLAKAEEHIQKLQVVVRERDDLRLQLKLRVNERDQLSGQYEQFRNHLKELVGQADSAVLRFPDGEPVSVTITMPPYTR
jgi:chromosome segregation ATPase